MFYRISDKLKNKATKLKISPKLLLFSLSAIKSDLLSDIHTVQLFIGVVCADLKKTYLRKKRINTQLNQDLYKSATSLVYQDVLNRYTDKKFGFLKIDNYFDVTKPIHKYEFECWDFTRKEIHELQKKYVTKLNEDSFLLIIKKKCSKEYFELPEVERLCQHIKNRILGYLN